MRVLITTNRKLVLIWRVGCTYLLIDKKEYKNFEIEEAFLVILAYIHYIYGYTYTYIIYIHTHIHEEAFLVILAYIHYIYICIYIYAYIHTHMHTYSHPLKRTGGVEPSHSQRHTYTIFMYMYIHTYIHIYDVHAYSHLPKRRGGL